MTVNIYSREEIGTWDYYQVFKETGNLADMTTDLGLLVSEKINFNPEANQTIKQKLSEIENKCKEIKELL